MGPLLLLAIALLVVHSRSFLLQPPGGLTPPLGRLASSGVTLGDSVKGEPLSKEEEERKPLPLAREVVEEAHRQLQDAFAEVDSQTQARLKRILQAYRKHQVGTHLFNGVDGYGHGDLGRDVLEEVYADLFGAEAALVRVQMFSGTHAISCALYGVLRPGDKMLGISGRPYDTLEEVIGIRGPRHQVDTQVFLMCLPLVCTAQQSSSSSDDCDRLRPLTGSMKEWGIGYDQVPLHSNGTFDLDAIDARLSSDPAIRVLHIQRSCGYQWRPSVPIAEISRAIAHIRSTWAQKDPQRELIIFVDNCYGELVEDREPTHVGADLVAGSLIKNPGGTLAPTGGYVIGKRHYVQAAFKRLSAPGVEGGATLGQTKRLYQGLFLSPTIIGESLKGSMLLAQVFGARFGLPCNPAPGAFRTDIIQALQVGTKERILQFCKQVQGFSPVGAYIQPTAGATPGYGDEVVFADGTFVDGSTLELSADGPLREPYVVYVQGCTHWTHWAIILENALVDMGLAR